MSEVPWQYFSKLYHKWIDAKYYDCKESLLKCGYEIRNTPKQEEEKIDHDQQSV